MSVTLKGLPYARFVRQARTDQVALVATQAALNQAIELLKVAPWRKTSKDLKITMPASDPKQTKSSDAYDAYKFSGDCPEKSGVQAAFVGMAAYRWELPTSALNNDPAVTLTAAVNIYTNKFLSAGLRIVAFTSDEENPESLGSWAYMRGDEGGVGIIKSQFVNTAAGTNASTNKSAIVTIVTDVAVAKYLWLIVQLENWAEIKFEYWIEGAGFVGAETLAATFDLDTVVLDAAEPDVVIPVVLGGNVYAPLLDEKLIVDEGGRVLLSDVTTREFSAASFTISPTAIKSEPTSASAVAAIPALFARILNSGAQPLKVTDLMVNGVSTSKQAGLTTTITRRILGTSNPFEQRLYALISPLAALTSLPNGVAASVATITNNSEESIVVRGCDMSLDLWFASEKELTLQEVGACASGIGFWYDGSAAGNVAMVGTVVFPEVFPPGSSLLMPLTGTVARWGTLILAFRILRVTANELACDDFIGVRGVSITSESISGNGWYPDLTIA